FYVRHQVVKQVKSNCRYQLKSLDVHQYILCDRRTSFKERLTPMPVTHSVWIYPAETLKTVVFLSSMWLSIFGVTLTLCVLVGAGWWSVAWVAATVVVVCLMEKLVDHLHECRQI
ncbi:MAG: hypothetical protein K2W95_35745, partial [Candidatus Obscuribacterales bacterium]|nr:hypothetical protein [Candidatus Obscuribacterales bacterium]